MRFHPYSEIFPLLEGAPFDELVADIEVFGLREPIWTYKKQILDGRNRFMACKKAKVEPEYREFKGLEAGALAFVISANLRRRQLTEAQRAMAAARIATLQQGGDGSNQHGAANASREAIPQAAAAEQMDVSRSSVQRARKVIDKGSKALQAAVEAGEVPLKKAAAVVDLPKTEQLAAAKKKPEPVANDEPERPEWEPSEDERLVAVEKEYAASIDKVMEATDKLAAAHTEIKRQAAEIATLKFSRDGYQNQCGELIRRIKGLQRKLEKLEPRAA